jgi:hypothetical protein
VWVAAIGAGALTLGLMAAAFFASPTVTTVLVPLAVIGAGIAAVTLPGLLPDPLPDTDLDAAADRPIVRRAPIDRSITAHVLFTEYHANGICLDCVVTRGNPWLPDLPIGLPIHLVLAVPESSLLAALSGSLFQRWCSEPGVVEVELTPTAEPPRAMVSKGDAHVLFEVRTSTTAGG